MGNKEGEYRLNDDLDELECARSMSMAISHAMNTLVMLGTYETMTDLQRSYIHNHIDNSWMTIDKMRNSGNGIRAVYELFTELLQVHDSDEAMKRLIKKDSTLSQIAAGKDALAKKKEEIDKDVADMESKIADYLAQTATIIEQDTFEKRN